MEEKNLLSPPVSISVSEYDAAMELVELSKLPFDPRCLWPSNSNHSLDEQIW